jgi:hypothetical protein
VTHSIILLFFEWIIIRMRAMSLTRYQSSPSLNMLQILRSHPLLRPSEDREELDKLLHTSDVISMRLLSIEFDSELLIMSACSI